MLSATVLLITATLMSPGENRTIQTCKYLMSKKQTADSFSSF